MNRFTLCLLGMLLAAAPLCGFAQDRPLPDHIRSVKLYRVGDQTSFPAISLSGGESLYLDFDDMEGRVRNYYYTFQLCNADWSPSVLRPFEYIRGFQNVRINTYRNSSIALTRYIHYQATVPDRNCMPTKSGNYLLKVYLDGDTSNLVFTRRMVVTGNEASVAAQVQQPFNAQNFRTAQKLSIAVQTDSRIRIFSPSDIKVVVLQNNNWQTALYMDRPTLSRGNYFEYSDESITAMQAGKEFRWLDLRSLRLLSDRVQRAQNSPDSTHIYVRPDQTRNGVPYLYYRDLNGAYTIETLESINPFWQGDYAWVHFTYLPPNNQAFAGRDVYLFGELTGFATDTASRMQFNAATGAYEKVLPLKQGYYSYNYVTLPANGQGLPDYSQTEGNYWGTENAYTILVYYRPFGNRADELIGWTTLNSQLERSVR